MCGRFTLYTNADLLADYFDVEIEELMPRFNIAPTQAASVILPPGRNGDRKLRSFRWGLIPSWAKDTTMGARMINARAETVSDKPAFRSAMEQRRCLIPADGFFEWQAHGKRKQPFYFRMKSGEPFAFAGLWDRWDSAQGEKIFSFTILTTTPNRTLGPYHDRMPVILRAPDYRKWLDTESNEPGTIRHMLLPYADAEMESFPVSTLVGNPLHDVKECVDPIGLPLE